MARVDRERNLFERRASGFVFETDVLEFHPAAQVRQRTGRGRVLPFRREIDQPKVPFRARHRCERLVVLVADDLDGIEEEVREEKEHYEIAGVHVQPAVPFQSAVTAEQCRDPEEQLALHLQQRDEHCRGASDAHVVFAVEIDQLAEESGVDLLSHERLRHANATDGFRERGRQSAPGFLHLAQGARCVPPINIVQHPDHRNEREHQRK